MPVLSRDRTGFLFYLYFMKNLSALLQDWRSARRKMERLTDDIPRIIGNEGVKIVKQNFSLQAYDSGIGVKKWPQRKASTNAAYMAGRGPGQNGRYKGTVYNSDKPLLQQSMNLYNAIEYRATKNSVSIGVNTTLIPYAKIHNEGGRGIPQRQYMPLKGHPPNIKMLRAIEKRIIRERKSIMRDFKK